MLMGKRFTNITKQIRLIVNNLGALVSICNPSTQEVEAGRFEFTVSCLQRKKKTQSQKKAPPCMMLAFTVLHRQERQPEVARGGGGSES